MVTHAVMTVHSLRVSLGVTQRHATDVGGIHVGFTWLLAGDAIQALAGGGSLSLPLSWESPVAAANVSTQIVGLV